MNSDGRSAITFLGAARTVTGSKHLLQTNGSTILVDAGLFQGLKALRERNWQALPLRASTTDAVVLTHAHLDHCGYLPRLVAQGFRGRVFCTPATAQLARVVMADAAYLQEEDAERANRKGYTRHRPALPLFTVEDADRAMTLLQPVGYDRPIPVAAGVTVEFINAGHLLGSSYARIRVDATGKTVLFGGDLGRYGRPVLPDPEPVGEADVVVLESTYGDRVHTADDHGERLAHIINGALQRQGKLIMPAFALGRVEEILYWIQRLENERRIPILPVYVDSPMASSVLAIYRDRLHELDPDVRQPGEERRRAQRSVYAFSTTNLKVITSIRESRDLQESRRPAIIVSSSGMATGGRVLHHLVAALPDARNTVFFAGYQAAGTRGRQLCEGARVVRIHGQDIPVLAHVEQMDSMSAHADANEIMRWLSGFRTPPALTCLVHGEPGPMDALKARIERELHWTVRTPGHQEKIDIWD
jgi:metallo-beta-lactamase family protein